ncbi:hypothetical protein GCM10009076_26920 [Erythrobacter ramosus]
MKAIQQIEGEWWFSARYASGLLNSTTKKVEAMATRGLVRSIQVENTYLIAETDVTNLRRNPDALKAIKEASKMPAHPRKGERMPDGTSYVGDSKAPRKTKGRLGNPLADEGHR